jgi:NAD(P)H-dependent FMN reductase
MAEIKALGLCGSLRASSTNRILLEAAQALAPSPMRITSIADGSIVPHFNPDLEEHSLKAGHWREMVGEALSETSGDLLRDRSVAGRA